MTYDAGTGVMAVVPDFRGVEAAIRREAAKWGVTAGQAFGKAFNTTVRAQLRDLPAGPAPARASRQGAESGGSFADAFRKQVQRAMSALPPVEIGAATTEAEQKLRDLRIQMEALSGKRVGVDIDATAALAEVQRIQQELDELGRTSPDVQIRADSTEASARLAKITAQVEALAASDPTIRVQVDEGAFAQRIRAALTGALKALPPAQLTADASDAERRLAEIRAELLALSDQRIGIDVDATAAALHIRALHAELTSLATRNPDIRVSTNAASAAAQLAALNAAVASVGSTSIGSTRHVSGLAIAGASLGPLIVPAAAAAAAAVAAIGTAALAGVAGIGVAVIGFMGVGDAVKAMGAVQQEAGKSAAQLAQQHAQVAGATDSLRSAERSLANTRASNADGARRSAAAVADAERGVARAQDQARQATLDLVRAREEERRANQDLALDVEGVAIAQRRANLDLTQAKRDLDRVLANPRATDEQRENARVAYDEIELRVRELALQHQRLTDEQAENARVGVDGSARVQAAQQRVKDTTEGVAESQRALTEALLAQQSQQRQSAFALAGAQQSVVAAQRSLEQASVSAGLAGSAAMDKLNQSMAALSPAGQRFAKFIFGIKGELKRVQAAAAEGMLPGVQAGLEKLLPYLPQVENFVGRVATKMGDLADRSAKALTGPGWEKFFGFLNRTAVPALDDMATGTGNLILGFANLLAAFEPMSDDVSKGLLGLTERFVAWTASLDSNAGFQSFLRYVREYGPVVSKFFGDLVVVVGKLLVGLAPLGALMIAGLGWLADFLAGLDPGVLAAVAGGVSAIVATLIIMAIGPVAAIAAIIAAVVGLVGAVVYAYNRVSWFKTGVNAVFGAIGTAAVWLWRQVFVPVWTGIAAVAVWAWKNVLQPAWSAMLFVIRDVLAPIFLWFWRNIIVPAWQAIGLAVDVASAVIGLALGSMHLFIKLVLAPVFTWLYDKIIKPVWDGIKTTISGAWNNGIKPVFNALGGFLRDHVAPAFRAGVDAIGAAWARIRDVAKIPVRFVVDTILNQAIIRNFNKIATKFGVAAVDEVKLPDGFAAGGILPGYTPGKDVHRFYSPTAGTLALSGGEAIIRPEGTRALGAGWVDGINRAARGGGVAGVQRWLGGFEDGGILGTLGRAAKRATALAGDAITSAVGFVTDPVGTLKRVADQVIGLIPGEPSAFKEILSEAPRRIVTGITDQLTSWIGGDNGDDAPHGVGNALGGSAGMMRLLRVPFPTLPLLSGYRAGSVTLTGNRSYHASDRAVDVPPIRAVAEWIKQQWGATTKELITPWHDLNLLNGRPHVYTGAVWTQHNFAGGNAHGHWAYDQGGMLPPGLTTVYNGTGKPEPVFTNAQWQTLRAATNHAEPRAGRQYNFSFADTTLTPQRLRAMQDREDALALTGRPT